MKRTLCAAAVFAGAVGLSACSSSNIPAGQMSGLNGDDGGGGSGGASTGSTSGSGGSSTTSGGSGGSDPGACAPSDCANLPMPLIAKLCPDGSTVTANVCARQSSTGQCNWDFPPCPGADASAGEAGTSEAGANCCPANWSMYDCTFQDGGRGLACHNPALGCASSLACGQSCDPVVTGRCGPPMYKWYATCGYPVCQVDVDAGSSDAGPACPAVGSACATLGDKCGTPSPANCGVTYVCSDHDPKAGPAGCPISSRQYKSGIEYLDEAELAQLHDDTLRIKLATYKYKPEVANPEPSHLGFIIEDNPGSPAVDAEHHRVDLYGYVSMVVATMQVQEKEITELRKELEATRRSAASCRAARK